VIRLVANPPLDFAHFSVTVASASCRIFDASEWNGLRPVQYVVYSEFMCAVACESVGLTTRTTPRLPMLILLAQRRVALHDNRSHCVRSRHALFFLYNRSPLAPNLTLLGTMIARFSHSLLFTISLLYCVAAGSIVHVGRSPPKANNTIVQVISTSDLQEHLRC
jgi:hypothetical protein